MSKLKVLKFINSNPDWRKILSSSPYNLIFRDFDGYTLIKYNQLFSNFKETMVKESRGFILKKEGYKYKLVCMPFTKFFCVRDPNAKNDLRKLYHRKEWYIEEKIDGSLIKLFYDNGKWNVSTSGTINAKDAEVQFKMKGVNNFKELFDCASKDKINYDKLDKQYTYMFELVSLENKVIVPYEIEDVYYLGRRNNYTLRETPYFEDECVGVERCKRPKCKIIKVNKNPKKTMKQLQDEVDNFTKENENFEGYVISDKSLKTRVKMKSKQYMELFIQKGNGIFTPRKILLLILNSKDDDIISSFPEYKPQFEEVRSKLIFWVENIKKDLLEMKSMTWDNKKDFAEWTKDKTYPPIMFSAYNNDNCDEEWLEQQIKRIFINKLLETLNLEV